MHPSCAFLSAALASATALASAVFPSAGFHIVKAHQSRLPGTVQVLLDVALSIARGMEMLGMEVGIEGIENPSLTCFWRRYSIRSIAFVIEVNLDSIVCSIVFINRLQGWAGVLRAVVSPMGGARAYVAYVPRAHARHLIGGAHPRSANQIGPSLIGPFSNDLRNRHGRMRTRHRLADDGVGCATRKIRMSNVSIGLKNHGQEQMQDV
jgi:hypothetical protein